jgi:glycosyltransferase involved in cell wall biosynthesis
VSASFNPLDHPIVFSNPRRLTPFSAWHEHIPFAMLLVDLLRPNLFVQLGIHYGDSYCTFCQAVQELDLRTRCCAIDNWDGDSHAGFCGPEVLADLRVHHDLYGNFSSLVKSSFDDGLKQFSDGSIDLLHIDGYYTHEVVRRDFESWLPKTSSRGVILFHDVNVREADFGVRELWDEVKERYPYFEFIHGHGLGVLAVGPEQPEAFQALLQASRQEVLAIRNFFFQLGSRLTLTEEAQLAAERDRLNQEIKQFRAKVQRQQHALDAKGHELVQLAAERERLIKRLQSSTQAHEQELEIIRNTIGWRVLDKYRETRQKSLVLKYLHFLLTEPVKRVAKRKIAIRHKAKAAVVEASAETIDLTSPNDLCLDARLQCPSTSARSVLVLGSWLPAADRTAGGLRAFNILQILREKGYIVVFGADREKLEHVWLFGSTQEVNQYEIMLERLNIEVLYGSKAVLRHLHENGYEYQFVVLSYPEVAYRYFSYVRAYAINAKVVYDPVDLHWLRMERESAIKDDDVLRQQSENYRQMEGFNAAAADIVFAVTQEEKSQILKEVKDAKVEVIPTIHDCVDKVKPLADRKNLLFVGHYSHSPNEDAVSYFVKEIFPLIRQDIPGVVFYMVGSNITETVKSLASRDVVAVGYVPDLMPYLEGCRVFVAPLRYGAGIKGKIAQSMGFGLPVVTTSIGAEGMNLIDGEHVLIADSPAAFARAVVRLYTDDLLWERTSLNALLHIQTHFSKAVIQKKLAQIFAAESRVERSSARSDE